MTNEEYNSLIKLIKLANRRLDRLENFTGKDVSWAGKRLKSKINNGKLNGWANNRITVSSSMSDNELQRIEQATRSFMNSHASTITGIRKIMRDTKKSMAGNMSISKEQAETLYQMTDEDTFTYIKEHSTARSSEMWAVIQEAKEKRYSYDRFEKRMKEIAQVVPDEEMRANLQSLFIDEVWEKK